ncbi:MAG: phosphatidylserine decarboxylase family protein [Pelagibacteraceae bacterium]|nr:phosphatidylserine decarboxylase family protein [Pelagibacteraceae bacterium]|tara:strand:- start:2139 stop:2795 length:657 start_codon:yes stop_codon:yes gene_type:complete
MYFRFHKEISTSAIIVFLLIIFFYFIYIPFFVFFLIILTFILYFFRDPERTIPLGEDILVAPADGLITNITKLKIGKKNYTKISIFLSVFDVHIQRLPTSGKLEKIDYFEGKFLSATLDKSSDENERLTISIKNSKGIIQVTQIAGLIARRIMCYIKENDDLAQGEQYGIIKFGSRVDLSFPEVYSINVAEGQRSIGGETIIAYDKKTLKQDRKFKTI